MKKHSFYQNLYCVVATLLLASCATSQQTVLDHKQRQETERFAQEIFAVLAGDIATQSGDIPSAIAYYKEAAISSKNESLFANALALTFHSEQYDEAKSIGLSWEKINPESLLMNKALAMVYMRSEKPLQAVPHVERVIRESKNFYRADSMLRDILDLGLESDAVAEWATSNPDNPYLLLLKSLFAFNAQDYQSALQWSQDVLSKDPQLLIAIALQADALFALGRVEEGLELLQVQSQTHLNNPGLLLKSARKHFLYDRDIKALTSYQQFLLSYGKDLSPQSDYEELVNTLEASYAIATIKLGMHQYQNARELFSDLYRYALATEHASEIQKSVYYLARVDEMQGEYDQAIARYRSIYGNNLFSESRIGIARIFIEKGDYKEIPRLFDKARLQTSHDRTKIALFIAQAEMMKDIASAKEVLQVYSTALKQYPNELNLLYSRAMFYNSIKDLAATKKDLKRIIKFDSRNWRALNALGYLLVESNRDLTEAREYLAHAYQLQPNSAAVIDSIGWLEFRLNNLQKAEQYIRRAAGMHLHPEILGHLAEVFLSQHRKQEAAGVLERALNHFPDNEYLIKLYEAKKDI